MKQALLITRRGDVAAEGVAHALARRGVEPVVLLTDAYPGAVHVAGDGETLRVTTPAGRFTFGPDDAVWNRRRAIGADRSPHLAPQDRVTLAERATRALDDLLDAFPGAVFDPPGAVDAAANKSWQHRVAREVGLRVPDTLLTSSPDDAAAFLDGLRGPAVTKLVAGTPVADASGRRNMPTRAVDDAVRAGLAGLRYCPQLFQPAIPKAYELRVTVIGARVSVARLDSAAIAGAETDWRLTNATSWDQWRAGTLPDEVTHALLRLLDLAGLQYGAADVIVTPDGEHVFLEVNPSGEFGWLEVAPPHFPHSAWWADVITGIAGSRRRLCPP